MNTVRTSKLMSLILRHRPELMGVELEPGGWAPVEALLQGMRKQGHAITREDLDRVVAENDKQRFEFDETGTRIRARQGHSVEVDLQLQPKDPPPFLYHGTVPRSLEAIRRDGLTKQSRHHVHLSPDVETATRVGQRRGKPVILRIDSGAMARDGHVFYQTANEVWLTERVPPEYLEEDASLPPHHQPSAKQ